MNQRMMSRIVAAVILGIIFTGRVYQLMERRVQAGADAYLIEQKQHWDTVYARPQQVDRQILSVIVLFFVLVFVYECLSFGLEQLFRRLKRDDQP